MILEDAICVACLGLSRLNTYRERLANAKEQPSPQPIIEPRRTNRRTGRQKTNRPNQQKLLTFFALGAMLNEV